MDGSRFDRLTRQLATGQSRRSVLKGFLGLSGSALLGSTLTDETDARRSSSAGTTTTLEPVSVCAADSFECGGNCCSLDQSCCNGGCCDGSCTIGGACCPAVNTTCGADCCSPEQACCGGECCNGTCYGEELCCPAPRLFNFDAWVCCPEGTRPCGLLCTPDGTCCSDDECAGLSDVCNTGRCSESGGSCYADQIPDGTPFNDGASVCLNGLPCDLAGCGAADCGPITEANCGQTIQCPTCTGEGCATDGECLSKRCSTIDGTCCEPRTACDADCGIIEDGCGGVLTCASCDVGKTCDEDADCTSNRCYQDACCDPKTVCEAEIDCGPGVDDLCGDTIFCQFCLDTPCTEDSDCYSGSCNRGFCKKPVLAGGECDSVEDCASNTAFCENGRCLEPLGGGCQTSEGCLGNLICDSENTCRVELGGVCTGLDDCQAGQECQSDGTCGLSLDQPCTLLEELDVCADGLACTCFDIFIEVCTAPCTPRSWCNDAGVCKVPFNGACGDTSECAPFWTCSDGKCIFEPLPVGSICGDDTYCAEGLVCECPDSTIPGSCYPKPGVCRGGASAECTQDTDCADGLVCNTIVFANGEAKRCQIPVGESCDGSLGQFFSGLQCETGVCGPTFFRPSSENPVCCLPQHGVCSSDDDCCKLPNPFFTPGRPQFGPPFSATRCKSSGACGRVSRQGGDPCLEERDCAPWFVCELPSDSGSSQKICRLPIVPVARGGICDQTGANRDQICDQGLACIRCGENIYRCADADNPCCANNSVDDFWCGQIADPEGGYRSNLCCDYSCTRINDRRNCGQCGNDCLVPSNAPCAVPGAAGTCSLVGEDPECVYPDVCANGVDGDPTRRLCNPYYTPPSAEWVFCNFSGEPQCEGGGCGCWPAGQVVNDPSLICVVPSNEVCQSGRSCNDDLDCAGGVCVTSCSQQNNPFCGVGQPERCVCPGD